MVKIAAHGFVFTTVRREKSSNSLIRNVTNEKGGGFHRRLSISFLY